VLTSQIEKYKSLIGDVDSQLKMTRDWYGATTDAVLNNNPKSKINLSTDEVNLYKEFDNDRNGVKYQEYINKLKKQYPDITTEGLPNQGGIATRTTVESPQVREARNHLAKYINTKNKVDEGKSNFLKFARTDVIDSDAIKFDKKDSEYIANELLKNTTGLQIFDDEGKNLASEKLEGKGISWFDGSGDNYSFSFANGDLPKYIQRYGVKMNVNMAGPSTKLGNGNPVVEVTFSDPTGNIPSNKKYYIPVNKQVSKTISSKYSNNPNPEVRKLSGYIGDDEANYIRSQFLAPSYNRTFGKEGSEPYEHIVNVTSRDGRKIPLIVTNVSDGDENHFTVFMRKTDGSLAPFPIVQLDAEGKPLLNDKGQTIPANRIQGNFANAEDFIQQFQAQR